MDSSAMGQFICQMRKERGMTQKQLSEKLSVTDKAVSKWERGQGYPDISIITKLADILGISVNELLEGKASETPVTETKTHEPTIYRVLDYAEKSMKRNFKKLSAFALIGISFLFLIAAVVCLICDYAINNSLTWSPIPIVSLIFTFSIVFPLLYCKTKRIRKSLIVLTLLILPFLYILEKAISLVTDHAEMLMTIGLAPTILGAALLWALYIIFTVKNPRNYWFRGAVGAVVTGIFSVAINFSVNAALGHQQRDNILDSAINLAGTILITFLFLALGIAKKQRESKRDD